MLTCNAEQDLRKQSRKIKKEHEDLHGDTLNQHNNKEIRNVETLNINDKLGKKLNRTISSPIDIETVETQIITDHRIENVTEK